MTIYCLFYKCATLNSPLLNIYVVSFNDISNCKGHLCTLNVFLYEKLFPQEWEKFKTLCVCVCVCVCVCLSNVQLFAIPWTKACQAPLPMGLSRQEHWSGCHSLLQGIFLTLGLWHCRQIL